MERAGGRDIDGQIRVGSGRADRRQEQTTYWLELLVDGKIVPADKLSIVRQECDELIRHFCYDSEELEGLVIPGS